MTDNAITQVLFTEKAIRDGHSMAAVQMWQSLCRKLALLAESTRTVALVMLRLSMENGMSPLALCDDLIANGIKKIEDKNALEVLGNLEAAYDAENTDNRANSASSSTDEAKQATQPMTPVKRGRSGLMSPQSSPRPDRRTWAPTKRGRVIDLTVSEDEEEE